RYVLSAGLKEERAAGRGLFSGLLDIDPSEAPRFKNTGNTNIVWHAGRLLALMEAAFPTRMEPRTLETLGELDFDGRLAGPMNAFAEGDAIVLDVARYGRLDFMSPQAAANPSYRDENAARMHRWRIDLRAGGVKSTPLDDIVTEFPRVDERRLGRRHRFGYTAAREPELDDGAQPVWT